MIKTVLRVVSGVCVALVVLVWGAAVMAQTAPPSVELTPFQLELDKKAAEAYLKGDYGRAVSLYETSLESGQANITWLSLGRALFKMGRCADASQALDKVMTAPRVPKPSPEEVEAALERYRLEMAELCDGKLKVVCAQPEVQIQIDEGPKQACSAAPMSIAPGAHRLRATLHGLSQERKVSIEPLKTSRVEVAFERDAVVLALLKGGQCDKARQFMGADEPTGDVKAAFDASCGPAVVATPDGGGPGGLSTAGWVLTTVGGAALLLGTTVDIVVLGALFSDLEDAGQRGAADEFAEIESDIAETQAVNLGIFVVGGALAATGLVLILLDGDDESAQDARALDLGGWVDGDGGGVQLRGRW